MLYQKVKCFSITFALVLASSVFAQSNFVKTYQCTAPKQEGQFNYITYEVSLVEKILNTQGKVINRETIATFKTSSSGEGGYSTYKDGKYMGRLTGDSHAQCKELQRQFIRESGRQFSELQINDSDRGNQKDDSSPSKRPFSKSPSALDA